MDTELKELAALALRNAFWTDFSALVNKYLAAAEGLDTDRQEMQMGELTSVYGRDTEAESDEPVNIWTRKSNGNTYGHATIIDALRSTDATEIFVGEKAVFERRNGEWYFTGD